MFESLSAQQRFGTFKPRMPNKDVIKAFGSLLSKLVEPLGNPGAAMTGLFIDGTTFEEEVAAEVNRFNQAVADQELWG